MSDTVNNINYLKNEYKRFRAYSNYSMSCLHNHDKKLKFEPKFFKGFHIYQIFVL